MRNYRSIAILAALLAVIVATSFGPLYYLSITILICYYLLLAIGWNIVAGYTGLPSFAQAAFASLAGYASALAISYTNFPVFFGILVGFLAIGGAAAVVGYGSVRLAGSYLALATIAFSEGIRQTLYAESSITGGGSGYFTIPVIPHGTIYQYYYLYIGVSAAVVYLSYRLTRSKLGLLMRSVGSDEEAAAMAGVNVGRVRLYAFTISGLFAAAGGLLYAHYSLILFPNHGSLSEMGTVLIIDLFGGLGTVYGPVVGSFVIILVREYIRTIVGPYDVLVFGILIIIMMRFARGGVVGMIDSIIGSRKKRG